jgi:HEPN domain-containing protein
MPHERIMELVDLWWQGAQGDLKTARLAEEVPFASCFHSQQAVEKAVKAVLVLHQIDFRPIHDLGELLDLLSRSATPLPENQDRAGFESLTRFAVETRYPPAGATAAEARRAVQLAERFLAWAGVVLKSASGGDTKVTV